MIAAILTMLLAAVDPDPGPPPAATPTVPAASAKPPVRQAEDNLEQAEQMYGQSCGERAYGAYDDLCSQLAAQVRQDRVDLNRLINAAATTPRTPKP